MSCVQRRLSKSQIGYDDKFRVHVNDRMNVKSVCLQEDDWAARGVAKCHLRHTTSTMLRLEDDQTKMKRIRTYTHFDDKNTDTCRLDLICMMKKKSHSKSLILKWIVWSSLIQQTCSHILEIPCLEEEDLSVIMTVFALINTLILHVFGKHYTGKQISWMSSKLFTHTWWVLRIITCWVSSIGHNTHFVLGSWQSKVHLMSGPICVHWAYVQQFQGSGACVKRAFVWTITVSYKHVNNAFFSNIYNVQEPPI